MSACAGGVDEAATVDDGDAGELVHAMLAVSENAIATIGAPVLRKVFIRNPCAALSEITIRTNSKALPIST